MCVCGGKVCGGKVKAACVGKVGNRAGAVSGGVVVAG